MNRKPDLLLVTPPSRNIVFQELSNDLVAIELKPGANMTLLIQATDRQAFTDSVYVGVPAPTNPHASQWRGIRRVLRRLELGLMTVDLDRQVPPVTIEFDPLPYQRKLLGKRRRAVIEDLAGRSGDYNIGGTTGQKRVTAYRETAIYIGTCMKQHNQPPPSGHPWLALPIFPQ